MNKMISKLSPIKVARYLELNNWTSLGDQFDGRVRQLMTPSGESTLLLPLDNEFSDYEETMSVVIRKIAAYEKITERRLYNKLINPSCDLLRWRIADDSTTNGLISFTSMSANIGAIKDLVGTTCLDILSPSIYHSKIYIKDVNEQLENYSFGQTEVGSYILNVLSTLGYYQYQLFDPDEEKLPIPRRINVRLLGNIEKIQRSALEHSQELKDNVESKDISVNFLNYLTGMYEENKDSEISISADWSHDIPFLDGQAKVDMIKLNPHCLERVMETIDEFTPKEEQNIPATFYGKITSMGTEAELADRTDFDIKIATIGEDLRTISVNANLNYASYFTIANQAFLGGAVVRVSGIMSKKARSVNLTDANLRIAD